MVEGKVSKEEIEQIVEEIENDEELETEGENEFSEEELEEMDLEEGKEEEDEEEGIEDEFEGEEESSVVKNYTIIQQPVVTEVNVGAETGAKGEVKPYAKVSINRHLDVDDTEFDTVVDVIADDFAALSELVESELLALKKKLNVGKPEMQ